jgi:hypothetical protein
MRVRITETVLRDANQSLIATRMSFHDFEAILEKLDQAGYHSIECWGGATFDSCLRYLHEDPWERLRKIKAKIKRTKLQMLLRGQNLIAYKHYPDDVVRKFVDHAIKNGIDIMRIFDALNDFRNIEVAVDQTLKSGGHAQGAICYTISPIHNLANYVKLAKELEEMGVDSICIKDMSGIMGPQEAYDMISALKDTVSKPIVLHTHSTTGLGPITYFKAVEAGCDVIDCAISAFAGGTSQLVKLNLGDLKLYLIVASVWALWHLPYYLVFLPEADIRAVMPVSRAVYVLVAFTTFLSWTIMFTELFRVSKSVWPCVILHTMEDSLVNLLVISGYISIAAGKEILISPINGIITSILYLAVGLGIRAYRIQSNHAGLALITGKDTVLSLGRNKKQPSPG